MNVTHIIGFYHSQLASGVAPSHTQFRMEIFHPPTITSLGIPAVAQRTVNILFPSTNIVGHSRYRVLVAHDSESFQKFILSS